jgi:hypothetical protein
MKSLKISRHPITKPVRMDTEGAIVAITSTWDNGGNRTIRFHLKTKLLQPGEGTWIVSCVNKVSDKEIIIDITQFD